MILNVQSGNVYRHAETFPEMVLLIDSVLREQRVSISGVGAGDNDLFSFSETPHTIHATDWWPDNNLHVSVNLETRYGGMVWYVSPERADQSSNGVDEYVWVSSNPSPPSFDPMVLSDPGSPLCYARESTLPLAKIRAALEEFCRTGSGSRPESISWVKGEINGEILEEG
ncbi:Imm1 family immunity protein [Streptomyces sp. NPDC089922]|uniref:Imm1 family immunity protein n=1 Tax=Streptomyces sp. NPDC089922 TaxID=3155189 RepID=UPI003413B368